MTRRDFLVSGIAAGITSATTPSIGAAKKSESNIHCYR